MTYLELRKVLAIIVTYRRGSCHLDAIDGLIRMMHERGDDIELTLGEDGIDTESLLDGNLECLGAGNGEFTCADYDLAIMRDY